MNDVWMSNRLIPANVLRVLRHINANRLIEAAGDYCKYI